MKSKILITITLLVSVFLYNSINANSKELHRVIILTDIEADPDDTQSLIRLLLYSNEINIKGIVASTSCWMKDRVNPSSIKRIIDNYAKVQPNLLKHNKNYPLAEKLYPLVKQGLPTYGMLGVGNDKDSEGSEWIIKVLEDDDDRPLWISTWGGVNTLAQALYKLKNTKSETELNKLIAKLRVYTISDQDDSGIWIRNNFPNLFYIVTPGDDYGRATWSAINTVIDGIDNSEISTTWIADNIQQGNGPLGAIYPDVAWGMEGDTPSFLPLIQNGLNNAEHPEWGGWGGRYEFYQPEYVEQMNSSGSGVPYEKETRAIWTNANDTYTPYILQEYGRAVKPDTASFSGYKVTLWRWRDDFQNDFAARMDWCTKSYKEANHKPIIILDKPTEITVKSGERFSIDALESYDPDGDHISFLWFNYPEAGTYKKPVAIEASENLHFATVVAPKVDKKETLHFILKVTDKGMPALANYKRIIINVTPE